MIAITLRLLKKNFSNLKVIVSYADKDQGHEGGIYKGGNWKLCGKINDPHVILFGKKTHPRSIFAKYKTRSLEWIKKNIDPKAEKCETLGKKRFVYFLR